MTGWRHAPKGAKRQRFRTPPYILAYDDAMATEFDSENHPVLQTIGNTAEILWLGVRDGIRNWLVTAA